jgi:hypothetical protein
MYHFNCTYDLENNTVTMVYVTKFSKCRAILVYVLQILMRQQHLVPQYECHDWSSRCVYSRLNKPQTNIYEYILFYLVSGNFDINMWGLILQYVLRILCRICLLFKSDRHDINEILLKVALNTINQTKPPTHMFCSGFMFYLYYLYLFTIYTYVQHDFHIKWYSYHLTVTRRVWHVEQELLTSGTPDFTHGF